MLHDFQIEQETKQTMLRLSSLFIMLNRVRIFLCADYYKHHRYIASMKQVAYLIADAIDKSRKHVRHFLKNATKCQVKKAAPKTKNFTRHVSLYLNLEKPVPTVAFQEKIEDVAHLLDDEQSILATPTKHSHDSFWRHFLGFFLNPQTIHRSESLASRAKHASLAAAIEPLPCSVQYGTWNFP